MADKISFKLILRRTLKLSTHVDGLEERLNLLRDSEDFLETSIDLINYCRKRAKTSYTLRHKYHNNAALKFFHSVSPLYSFSEIARLEQKLGECRTACKQD